MDDAFGPPPPAPPTSLPPAGWHPDPSQAGRQRYWDGTEWTGHVAPGAGAPTGPAPGPASPDSRTWAMLAHLSALIAAFVVLSFIGPLIVYLVKRDEDPFVRDQAAEALNFNLSVLIYAAVGGVITLILIVVLVGLLLVPVLALGAVAWLVLVIVAAVKAYGGTAYRYPLTIRFVR